MSLSHLMWLNTPTFIIKKRTRITSLLSPTGFFEMKEKRVVDSTLFLKPVKREHFFLKSAPVSYGPLFLKGRNKEQQVS